MNLKTKKNLEYFFELINLDSYEIKEEMHIRLDKKIILLQGGTFVKGGSPEGRIINKRAAGNE